MALSGDSGSRVAHEWHTHSYEAKPAKRGQTSLSGVCAGERTFVRMERATRIELALSVWKTGALPLSYARVLHLM